MCALRCSLQLPLFLPKPLPPPSSAAPLARALSLAQAACAFAGILTSVDVQVSSRGDKNPAVLIAATSLMPLTAPISNMSACGAGFYRASCGAISNDGECVACTTKPLDASYMTAVSTADHSMCAWTCNAGYWRSNNSCIECNTSSCGAGFYRGPCGASSDAACQACTTKPLNASYTTPGSPWNVDNCSWTCNAGYWRFTKSTLSMFRSNASGMNSSKDRNASNVSSHVSYSESAANFSQYLQGFTGSITSCARCNTSSCDVGFYRGPCGTSSDAACQTCNASACGVGFYRGPCGTSSDAACQACTTKPLNASYTTPGSPWNVDNCSWTCNAGYWRSGSLASCVECSALYWNDGGKRICVKNATLCLEQRVSGISLERASCTDTTPGDCECIVGQV